MIGMMIAKRIGALLLSHARPPPRPLPIQMLRGPMRKAVSGMMITKEMKGTNTICTFAGTTFFKPLYRSAKIGTISRGTNTWPP